MTERGPVRLGPLVVYVGDGIGWFRLFGRGLHWKDTARHRLVFSERNYGSGRVFLQWGTWRWRLLWRWRP